MGEQNIQNKTLKLLDGKYTLVFDPTGTIPQKILSHRMPWKIVMENNVGIIFDLCTEIVNQHILIDKLEQKQIPMQIKEAHVDEIICPNCGEEICCNDKKYEYDYCPNCGQRLYQKENNLND